MLIFPLLLSFAALFLVRNSSPPWALMALAMISLGSSSAALAIGPKPTRTATASDGTSMSDMRFSGNCEDVPPVLFGTFQRLFLAHVRNASDCGTFHLPHPECQF